jgi:mono/diheme cytochrome c family protein
MVTMFESLLRRGAPLALAVIVGIGIAGPVIGQNSSSSSAPEYSSAGAASSASSASAAPAAAMSDDDRIAAGKHIWQDAACYNCHGTNGQGGHSPDFPAGPNLRTSGLDPDTMLMMVECGIPNTRMPAWLKGAYTDVACYGNPLGPAPAGTLISGAYNEDDLKNLVDYVQTNFMKQPMPTWSTQ